MLDNREIATLVWLGLAAAGALSMRAVRAGLGGALRLLLKPVILLPLGAMLAYVALEVWVGSKLTLWNMGLLKGTVIWAGGSALVLFFNCATKRGAPGFFRNAALGTVGVMVFVEFFMNLFVMNLPLELILQPVLVGLVLLAVAAEMQPEYGRVRVVIDCALALVALVLLAFTAKQLYQTWPEIDVRLLLLEFALPVWLTIGLLPFLYFLALYISYDFAFRGVNWATAESGPRWRARIALATSFWLRVGELAEFRWYWAKRISEAESLQAARRLVADFRRQRREEKQAATERKERLRRYAGSEESDAEGRRLDRREFKETTDALRWAATCQMGWYRRQGRYKDDLLKILGEDFVRHGLPEKAGVRIRVAVDGQAWFAWRETITGWCFAIGAAGPPPDQWEYDGPQPPQGFPGDDQAWGTQPFSSEVNHNWSE